MRFPAVPAMIVALLLVGQSTAAAQSGDTKDADKLPPKQHFHLYLLMGQSNMAGRGTVRDEDRSTDRRILVLNKDHTWMPAAEPLHFDKPNIVGVGPGLAFARDMKASAAEEVVIGLVPCAVGGSLLKRWQKGGDL